MDLLTVGGAIIGAAAIYIVMARGQILHMLFNLDAFLLVVVGTLSSTFIAYPWATIRSIPKAFSLAFFPKKRESSLKMIEIVVGLSEKAKRAGLVGLQPEISGLHDKFLRNAVQMLIDGYDIDIIEDNLEKEILYVRERHQKVSSVFRMMATVAPIFGLLGTLLGVVQVLRNITDPKSMGAAMATAVAATFFGIFAANFVFLPVAVKLSEYSEDEILNMELITEGIVSIHKGDVPVITEKKLEGYLSAILREQSKQAKQI
ncbi:MAG: MotA/TolQ/ExbB proton channel family protein [Elusimicrobia bacterium]|nr:MotA/TolQ/ExbB proton channel family protein [Elusimicrobiota bacterium]MBU2614500.1 MotA/TolQ/ExbB proton channel family protein [Elusimicrobiota bacterium]